jgi:predicted tellurium resistance membrane protein TerC
MPANMFTFEMMGSLFTLTALETVLGIDNIIFLSILVGKLPIAQQAVARRLGLVLALGMRICLLLTLSWLASLTHPFFTAFDHPVSGRDLVLVLGGGFLIFKSTWEMFSGLEGEDDEDDGTASQVQRAQRRMFVITLIQIVFMDIIFSLDSVITAVGIAPARFIMITAMIFSMFIMLGFAKVIGDFVNKHPSMKVLALSFLVLIGTLLVAEGGGQKINKGYIYAAMAFAFIVECLNLWLRKKSDKPAELHGVARHSVLDKEGIPHFVHADAAKLSEAELRELVQQQAKQIAALQQKLKTAAE